MAEDREQRADDGNSKAEVGRGEEEWRILRLRIADFGLIELFENR